MKKSSNKLLTELERQKKYLDTLPPDYSFPLFNSRQAVESQRRSAYRNTAAAAREIVDNALEANATTVHIIFDYPRSRRKHERAESVTAVAFIDNGSGMLPEMARYGLSWGGGTHFDEPEFIGKFGFGLPNASINQTRLVEVYTRTKKGESFTRAALDIRTPPEHGLQTIPEPTPAELPDFVAEYLERIKEPLEHGTVVVWQNPDHLSYRMAAPLKEHLVDDFGVTYRYLLQNAEIVVEGMKVEPVDPLFLTPGMRYYVPMDQGGAAKSFEKQIPVKYYEDPATGARHLAKVESPAELVDLAPSILAVGTLDIKVGRFPPGFVDGSRSPDGRTNANRRWDIRKARRGMSFVRADREIETVDVFPRSQRDIANGLGKWPLLQGYAYHWGIEVKFSPQLDEALGITNDKQSVRPGEDFWRILATEEVDRVLNEENRFQSKTRARPPKAEASEEPTAAEQASTAADTAVGRKRVVPERSKPAAREKLEEKAKERSIVMNASLEEALAALEKEAQRRPYRVDYYDSLDGPFYRPELVGTQIVVHINRAHPFYEVLYGDLLRMRAGRRAKEAVDVLLITLAKAELGSDEADMELWYEAQRREVWSPFLRRAMKSLAQLIEAPDEDESEAAA